MEKVEENKNPKTASRQKQPVLYKIQSCRVCNDIIYLEDNQGFCRVFPTKVTFDISPKAGCSEVEYHDASGSFQSTRYVKKQMRFDVVIAERKLKTIISIANKRLKEANIALDIPDAVLERVKYAKVGD